MDSKVSYLEIGTKNAETSRVFFEQLFGWSFHSMENNGEGWFETPSIKAGLHGNDPNPQFFVFFNVADLDTAVAKVKELGGKIEEPENDDASSQEKAEPDEGAGNAAHKGRNDGGRQHHCSGGDRHAENLPLERDVFERDDVGVEYRPNPQP